MYSHKKNEHLDKIRKLTQGLIISGTLNIALATFFVYGLVNERPPVPYCELKPAAQNEQQISFADARSLSEVIRQFKSLTFEQLVSKLHDTQLVENGYTQRDLALSCLTSFYYFDLSHALQAHKMSLQKKILVFGDQGKGPIIKVDVYPALTDAQFQSIIHFAQTERWPLTSQGLFLTLQKSEQPYDKSLEETFFLTAEFTSAEMLLNRSSKALSKNDLLQIVLDGSWMMLSHFVQQQKTSQDLSEARRQKFLLDYIDNGSKTAAYALLRNENDFATKKLDDKHILSLLHLLTDKTDESQEFALYMLTSPRCQSVCQQAAFRLYEYAGKVIPETWSYKAALSEFAPQRVLIKKIENAVAAEKPKKVGSMPKEDVYIVQQGDSLWKISRQFNVEIETLRMQNKLQTDFLKPGTILRIP